MAFLAAAISFPVVGVLEGPVLMAADPPSAAQVRGLQKKVQKALRGGQLGQALGHARSLASLGGEKAAEALFKMGLQAQAPEIFNGFAKILAGMADDGAYRFFEKVGRGKNDARLIYLTDLLGQTKDPRAAKILAPLVDSSRIFVIRSTIAAIVRLRLRESVPPLLSLLERLDKKKDRGLIYQEVRDGLYEISGQDFDLVEDWMKWWDPIKESFEPDREETGKTRVIRKSRDKAPEFAGKQIFSKNVLFVIDTSGTMQYVVKDDIPGLGKADGTDAAGGLQKGDEPLTPENAILAKYWTRLEMAKRELIKALSAFDPKARVNVMQFHKAVKTLSKRLFRISPKTKQKAIQWVEKMEWSRFPGTNTLKALEDAFESAPTLTAIYFLSDGLPSADGKKNDDPIPLLGRVEALNRFRKVKIHTFGYDPVSLTTGIAHPEMEQANEFLRKLAERTGGTFTLLKVTDEKPPPDFK